MDDFACRMINLHLWETQYCPEARKEQRDDETQPTQPRETLMSAPEMESETAAEQLPECPDVPQAELTPR